jgi:mono/diheme cytochrome c family protein
MEHPINKHQNRIFQAFLGLMISLAFTSCYYDNEEELYPNPVACDTTNVTYSGTVAPILSENCNSCHGSTSPSAGIITDNYTDLQTIVQNGKFVGAINHLNGFSPMPKGGNKLSDCNLAKIEKWIDSGAPNN